MKPNLSNKNIILKILNTNNISNNINNQVNTDKNNILFNFLIILLFIICLLFLIFRYLEKKNKCINYK
jgi:ATP-dependent Zn protease